MNNSMKKHLLLLIAVFALFSSAFSQENKDEMVVALKAANAEQFAKHFDNSIDVKLPNSSEMKGVSKAQAASTVKNFFSENGIASCTITSQREMGGTMYVTGKLIGKNNYNITVMSKGADDKFSVITLRINN